MKRDQRRAHHDRVDPPQLSGCPNCGQSLRPHRACPACGYYKGRRVLRGDATS